MNKIRLSNKVFNCISLACMIFPKKHDMLCKIATEDIVEFISNNYRRRQYKIKKAKK